jgi:hypothetical protein
MNEKELSAPISLHMNGRFIGGVSENMLSKFLKKIDILRERNLIRLKAYVDKRIDNIRTIGIVVKEGDRSKVEKFCSLNRKKIM